MRWALVLLLLLGQLGCYTVRYQTRAPPGGLHHEERADFFFWGLVGSKDIDLDAICPDGVHAWHNEATFVNGFLFFITFGIYAPRTVVVDCAGK
jgi:hypothetical protein